MQTPQEIYVFKSYNLESTLLDKKPTTMVNVCHIIERDDKLVVELLDGAANPTRAGFWTGMKLKQILEKNNKTIFSYKVPENMPRKIFLFPNYQVSKGYVPLTPEEIQEFIKCRSEGIEFQKNNDHKPNDFYNPPKNCTDLILEDRF